MVVDPGKHTVSNVSNKKDNDAACLEGYYKKNEDKIRKLYLLLFEEHLPKEHCQKRK